MQHNPFSTRFIRPGKLSYQFENKDELTRIVGHFEVSKSQGAIVGPHGTGKTTLLETLSPYWNERGFIEQRVRPIAPENRIDIDWRAIHRHSLLVVDGFEQLTPPYRWWVRQRVRSKHARLLVTTHQENRLPTIFKASTSWERTLRISRMIFPGDSSSYERDWKSIWQASEGNVREYLFGLYHYCESHGLYASKSELRDTLTIA